MVKSRDINFISACGRASILSTTAPLVENYQIEYQKKKKKIHTFVTYSKFLTHVSTKPGVKWLWFQSGPPKMGSILSELPCNILKSDLPKRSSLGSWNHKDKLQPRKTSDYKQTPMSRIRLFHGGAHRWGRPVLCKQLRVLLGAMTFGGPGCYPKGIVLHACEKRLDATQVSGTH